MRKLIGLWIVFLGSLFVAQAEERIVSLNGTLSEMACALGFESQIVGVDVTSTYPASLQSKPKVGHNRNISAENVLSLRPSVILAIGSELNPQVLEQFRASGVKMVLLQQQNSVAGARELLSGLAKALGVPDRATPLLKTFDQQIAALSVTATQKKVLFVYARGAGSLSVGGQGTPFDQMIQLAGGKNAVAFRDFKPLTTESLVAANPDVIVLFDSGLKSVGGVDGFLKVPGVALTHAGKQRKIVSMDGELLSGFGLRLPAAIQELHQKIKS